MMLTDYMTRLGFSLNADSIIEIHNRGPFREVKTGVTIDDVVVTSVFKVMENVPQIIELIRREKTS